MKELVAHQKFKFRQVFLPIYRNIKNVFAHSHHLVPNSQCANGSFSKGATPIGSKSSDNADPHVCSSSRGAGG